MDKHADLPSIGQPAITLPGQNQLQVAQRALAKSGLAAF